MISCLSRRHLQPHPGCSLHYEAPRALVRRPWSALCCTSQMQQAAPMRQQQYSQARRMHSAVAAAVGDGGGHELTVAEVKKLTIQISSCSSVELLNDLVRRYWGVLDHIHIPTAMHKAALLGSSYQQQHSTKTAQALVSSLVQRLEAEPKLQGRLTTWGLGNTVWALAKLDMCTKHAGFLAEMASLTVEHGKSKSFSTQNVSNTAWAYAQLVRQTGKRPGYIDQLFETLAALAFKQLKDFHEQNVSNLMWALVYVQYYDRELVATLTQHYLGECLDDATSQSIANVAWALSELRHRDEQVMGQLVLEALARPDYGAESAQNVANLVYACAGIGCWRGLPGLQELGRGLKPERTQVQHVSNLAWAHAVMGSHQDWLLQLLDQVIHLKKEQVAKVHLGQIALYFMMLQDKYPQQLGAALSETPRLAQLRDAALQDRMAYNRAYANKPTSRHNTLLEACHAAWPSPHHVESWVSEDGGIIQCDIAVRLSTGERIAVYLHPTSAYTRTVPHLLLAGSQLAGHFMEHRGWLVVHVSEQDIQEWKAATDSTAYLQHLIHKVQEQHQDQHQHQQLEAPIPAAEPPSTPAVGTGQGTASGSMATPAPVSAPPAGSSIMVPGLPSTSPLWRSAPSSAAEPSTPILRQPPPRPGSGSGRVG